MKLFLLLALMQSPADTARARAVKVQTDSIRAETCRGGRLSASGLTCTAATASPRVTVLRRLANRIDSIERAALIQPPPPPSVNQKPVARIVATCVVGATQNKWTIDGRTSTDDHGIVSWYWRQSDPGRVPVTESWYTTGQSASNPDWTVTLIVTDAGGLKDSTSQDLRRATCTATTPPPPTDTTTPPPLPPIGSSTAELPRVILNFPYPTPTRTINVPAGADLQAALNAAQRGDELVLAAGASWTGNFTVASCGSGWITIRGPGPLAPMGTRVRPSTMANAPRVVTANTQPALHVSPGGCRLWLSGFEITVDPALTAQQYGIVILDGTDLVLDRMLVRGAPTTRTSRCVALNSRRTAIRDSWIDECHGPDFDAQAIAGYAGAGPFQIVNNYLAGSGENVIFGGAPLPASLAGMVPSDIEIRRNHIYTPITWRGVWSKKNLLELKSAVRVLIEENVFDGSWAHGQEGWAMILKSENQQGGCAWCYTADVTIRRNQIKHVGAGITIAGRTNNPDSTTSRIAIYDNVWDSVAVGVYGQSLNASAAGKKGFQVLGGVVAVTLERNVLAGANLQAALITEGGRPCTFRDNVWLAGTYGVFGAGTGGGIGTAGLSVGCGTGYVWSNQMLIGSSGGNAYPAGTVWLSAESQSTLAAQIRALVAAATAGVVIQP